MTSAGTRPGSISPAAARSRICCCASTTCLTTAGHTVSQLPNANVTVNTVWEDTAKAGGSVVRVSASYPLDFVASPLIFGQNSLNLNVTARGTVAE